MSSGRKPPGKMEAEAKILTSRMKGAPSPEQFFPILEKALDGEIFNDFHISVAYHSLATWKRNGKLQASDRSNPILAKLNSKFLSMLDKGQVRARALANVLWSVAHLSNVLPNFLDILPAVAAQVPVIAKDMNAQAVSNSLWAAATLKEAAPDVLKMMPTLAAQVPVTVKDMIAQHVSNSLWAAATLKEAAPDVLKMVPTLANQVPTIAKDMKPQELSNSLWAAATLKEAAPDVLKMVPALAAQLPGILKHMNAQDVSNTLAALVLLQGTVPEVYALLSQHKFALKAVKHFTNVFPEMNDADLHLAMPFVVWACAKVGVHHDELLTSVSQLFGSKKKCSKLTDWSVCALQWSYTVLDPKKRFQDLAKTLETVIRSRGLSESDVQNSQYGPSHFYSAR